MKIGISVRLDVTKIDKARLYKGEKGTYLDLTTFVDTDAKDEYENNGFISHSQTKEEREAKAEFPPILGNVKVFTPIERHRNKAHPNRKQNKNRLTTIFPFNCTVLESFT